MFQTKNFGSSKHLKNSDIYFSCSAKLSLDQTRDYFDVDIFVTETKFLALWNQELQCDIPLADIDAVHVDTDNYEICVFWLADKSKSFTLQHFPNASQSVPKLLGVLEYNVRRLVRARSRKKDKSVGKVDVARASFDLSAIADKNVVGLRTTKLPRSKTCTDLKMERRNPDNNNSDASDGAKSGLFVHLSFVSVFGNISPVFTTVLSAARLQDHPGRRPPNPWDDDASAEAAVVKEGHLMYLQIEDDLLDEGTTPWKSGRFLLK